MKPDPEMAAREKKAEEDSLAAAKVRGKGRGRVRVMGRVMGGGPGRRQGGHARG